MGLEDLSELLGQMPAIAKAVNAFTSETVQERAFHSLVDAFIGAQRESKGRDSAGPRHESTVDSSDAGVNGNARTRRRVSKAPAKEGGQRKRRATGLKVLGDLNLRPSGKKAFKAFVEEKQPSSMKERAAVAVYYLANTLGLNGVTSDHVFTCFKEATWRLPADLRNIMAQAASVDGYLDTSDGDDVKITTKGTNLVDHDLPRAKVK
jgi:hypothetical protein